MIRRSASIHVMGWRMDVLELTLLLAALHSGDASTRVMIFDVQAR